MIRTARSALEAVPPPAWVAAVLILLPLVVVLATYRGMLLLVAVGAAGLFGVAFTITWPLPMLVVYVALIPVEALLVLGPVGTLTRLVGIVFFGGYLLRRMGGLRMDAMPLVGWAFLVWAAMSAMWALDPAIAFTELVTVFQLALITVVIADLVSDQPRSVQTILWAYTGSAVVVAVIGIVEYVAGNGFGGDRASAFAEQGPAHLAAVLLPAFFFLAFQLTNRQRRAAVGLALLLVFTAILLSGTRSAWLAIAVTALVGLLPRVGRRAILPATLLGLAFLAILQVPEVGALYADRLSSALSTGGAGRVDIWAVGLSIITRNPIIGVGFANFPTAFTPEAIRATEVPGLNLGILVPATAPHSILIGTLAELGVVGLLLLAGFFISIFRRPGYGALSSPVKIILFGLLVQAFFLDLLERKQVWLIIALILGLGVAEMKERRRQAGEQKAGRIRFAERIRSTWGPAP